MFYGNEAGFLRMAELRRQAAAEERAREAVETAHARRREEEAEERARQARSAWSRAA